MNFAKRLRHKKPTEDTGIVTRQVPPVTVSQEPPLCSSTVDDASTSAPRSTVLHTFRHAVELNDVALSPNATHLAIAADACGHVTTSASNSVPDASVLVYEVATKGLRSVVPLHKSSVQAVDLTRDAAIGVSGDFAGVTLVWDASTGARRATLLRHRRAVTDVTILSHGNSVVSTGIDGSVRIWDVNTETCVRNLINNVSITAAGVSMDGNLIACACSDTTVRLWDARISKKLPNSLSHDGALTDCALTPDASVIVSTTEAGVLTLWDVGNRRVISTLKPGGKLFGCAITPNASRIVATGDRGLALFSDASVSDAACASFTRLEGHDNSLRIRRCAINDDGTITATVGFDHLACLHSLPQVDRDALPGLHAVAISPMASMTETENAFFAFINNGTPLQAAIVARAIDIDFNMKAVTRLSSVYVAHLCVRTLLGNGLTFPDEVLGGRAERSSFFYRKLYHKLSELVQSQRSYDFAVKILHDARESGILSSHDVNSILGDALSNEYTRDLFSQLVTVMSQVYTEVSSRISSMETRVDGIRDKVEDLKAHLDQMNVKRAHEAKIQRYASLVKFGLSLVPIFGSAAMAFVDSGVNIILSLDLESITSMGSELFSATTQFTIDYELARRRSKISDIDGRDIGDTFRAMKLAQQVLSDGFLKSLPEHDRRGLEKGLEAVFGRPIKLLRRNVDTIISEYREDVVARTDDVPPPEGPLVDNTQQKDVVPVRDLDWNAGFEESKLSSLFRERSVDREMLSLRQACLCSMYIVEQQFGELEAGISEAVESHLSIVFLDETRNNIYSLVNEAIFIKVARVVNGHLRQLISVKWGAHFDTASAGDDVLYGSVAKRLVAGVIALFPTLLSDQAPLENVNQEIEGLIEDDGEVNRISFIRIAALVTLRQQYRLHQYKPR